MGHGRSIASTAAAAVGGAAASRSRTMSSSSTRSPWQARTTRSARPAGRQDSRARASRRPAAARVRAPRHPPPELILWRSRLAVRTAAARAINKGAGIGRGETPNTLGPYPIPMRLRGQRGGHRGGEKLRMPSGLTPFPCDVMEGPAMQGGSSPNRVHTGHVWTGPPRSPSFPRYLGWPVCRERSSVSGKDSADAKRGGGCLSGPFAIVHECVT